MRINILTQVAFEILGIIDSGEFSSVTIDAVKHGIEAGTMFDFLANAGGDFTLLGAAERLELVSEWQSLLDVNARRKFGVENNGLCLLIAFLLEGIQRRARSDIR